MSFREDLERTAKAARTFLKNKGIAERYLDFRAEGEPQDKPPRIPVDANSEFLANRAMGDWAEDRLAVGFRECIGLHVAHYGEADSIAAGEPGFKDFYLSRTESVRRKGKRPDLLLFHEAVCDTDLTGQSIDDLSDLANSAMAAIEVRSSKFDAETYMRVRREELEAGKKPSRMCPSFTVKIEDLLVVYRWHQYHDIPQFYCQIFFDGAYMLGILDIMAI